MYWIIIVYIYLQDIDSDGYDEEEFEFPCCVEINEDLGFDVSIPDIDKVRYYLFSSMTWKSQNIETG